MREKDSGSIWSQYHWEILCASFFSLDLSWYHEVIFLHRCSHKFSGTLMTHQLEPSQLCPVQSWEAKHKKIFILFLQIFCNLLSLWCSNGLAIYYVQRNRTINMVSFLPNWEYKQSSFHIKFLWAKEREIDPEKAVKTLLFFLSLFCKDFRFRRVYVFIFILLLQIRKYDLFQ